MLKVVKKYIYKLHFILLIFSSCNNEIDNPLEEYVYGTQHEYSYEIVDSIIAEKWTGYHVKMISGNWLNQDLVDEVEWWHYVDIIIPNEVEFDKSLMFIDGGTKDEDFFRLDSTSISYAIKSKSIIANISNIPFQPINFLESEQNAFYEDDLIAFSWNRFLKSGAKKNDVEWLPRLPMTRAVVRAMDLVQDIAQKNKIDVTEFVVSGASKRGWTTWTTAAIDKRVIAIAPMVIDMLNLNESLENHYRSYGEYSLAIQDYVNYNIPDWMVTKEFEILMKYVEPYYFKEKFTMPKLLINAGSDEFFSTDSWRFYFNELPGDKYLQYIPNVNHSLNGRYLNENLFSFYTRIINDQVFPKLIWEIKNDSLISRVVTNQDYKVSIWKANNKDTRDFRLWEEGKLWSQTPIDRNSLNKYKINLIYNNSGYTATMLEFIFNPDSEFPLILTTGPYVTPNKYPYDSYIPNRVDVIKND